MTPEEALIRRFETRVRQLILNYGEEKAANEVLREQMAEKDRQINAMKEEMAQIKKDFKSLQTAHAIGSTNDTSRDAKELVNKLLREVNRCIELVKAGV
ncbi:MAG: hypothetical protein KBS94_00270 [Prevotella sp.]|nr:hypothetical protein [Candidatus Equicola faecalis]